MRRTDARNSLASRVPEIPRNAPSASEPAPPIKVMSFPAEIASWG